MSGTKLPSPWRNHSTPTTPTTTTGLSPAPQKLYNVTLCKMYFGSVSKKSKKSLKGTNLESLW